MNTCGTCKYKGKTITKLGDDKSDWEDIPTSFFLCNRIKHGNHSYGKGNERGEHAQVTDGSGYYAALCVEDDFGCILWEKK